VRSWLIRHRLRVLVHRIRYPGVPMFTEHAARELIGKRVIVGITHQTHDGRVLRRDQYQGRIVRATRVEGVVFQEPSGAEHSLPPDLRPYFGVRPGVHRFKSSGEIVDDPDLQTSWSYTLPPSSA
jgi:hypothetical protein